jgi:hypothetical protein
MQRAQDGVSRLRCCAIAYLTVHHGEPEADPKPTSAIVIRRLTATLNHAYYATPDSSWMTFSSLRFPVFSMTTTTRDRPRLLPPTAPSFPPPEIVTCSSGVKSASDCCKERGHPDIHLCLVHLAVPIRRRRPPRSVPNGTMKQEDEAGMRPND